MRLRSQRPLASFPSLHRSNLHLDSQKRQISNWLLSTEESLSAARVWTWHIPSWQASCCTSRSLVGIFYHRRANGCRQRSTGICPGCPKAGKTGTTPLLYHHLHVLELPVQNLIFLNFCMVNFYFCITRLHAKYTKICTVRKFPTVL